MTEPKTQTTQRPLMPGEELAIVYRKLRAAMELKYKIMDVLYPKIFSWKEMGSNSVLDMRDVHMDNFEKLKKIRELVEGYEP